MRGGLVVVVLALAGAAALVLVRLRLAETEAPASAPPLHAVQPGELAVLRLAGPPRARGRVHGQVLRGAIRTRLARLRPEDAGLSSFAVETCGSRLEPFLPPALREEIAGIAEGAGLTPAEVLFLNTCFDLAEFGLAGAEAGQEAFLQPAAAGPGPAVVRHLGAGALAGGDEALVVLVHEDRDPPLVLVTMPGMVGGLLGTRGPLAGAVRPVGEAVQPVLQGVSWPVYFRCTLDEPPAVGAGLPARPTRRASLCLVGEESGGGTLVVVPEGGCWFPSRDGYALAADLPADPADGRIAAGEAAAGSPAPARALLEGQAPAGVVSVRLRRTGEGVEVLVEREGRVFRALVPAHG